MRPSTLANSRSANNSVQRLKLKGVCFSRAGNSRVSIAMNLRYEFRPKRSISDGDASVMVCGGVLGKIARFGKPSIVFAGKHTG